MASRRLPHKYFIKSNLIKNVEHMGKQGDGQFLKRGTCVNI